MEMRERMQRRPEESERLDEEELRLRDQTLSRTPSDTDRSKTVSGIYAPMGGGEGMAPISGEKEGGAGERKEGPAKRSI
jgi:hypothetical protein